MIIILIKAKQISKSQLESHKVENKKKDKIVKKHDGELDNKCIFVMMFFLNRRQNKAAFLFISCLT